MAEIDEEMSAARMSPEDRAGLKQRLSAIGLLDSSDCTVAPPPMRPNTNIAHSIIGRLGLEVPAAGKRIGLFDAAMAALPMNVRPAHKATLSQVGYLWVFRESSGRF
jgi:hypothetical protein